jgi:hypothetical protein
MQLARAVAAKALADWAEPEQPQAADPEPSPGLAAVFALLGTAEPDLRAPTCNAPTCKPVDPALLFTRLAATVRDCIALEARLAAGAPASPRAAALFRRADSRRAPLREAFRRVTKDHPDRTELLREASTRLDEELAADPAQSTNATSLFFALCEELAIVIDFATLPDEYLDFAPDPQAPPPPED